MLGALTAAKSSRLPRLIFADHGSGFEKRKHLVGAQSKENSKFNLLIIPCCRSCVASLLVHLGSRVAQRVCSRSRHRAICSTQLQCPQKRPKSAINITNFITDFSVVLCVKSVEEMSLRLGQNRTCRDACETSRHCGASSCLYDPSSWLHVVIHLPSLTHIPPQLLFCDTVSTGGAILSILTQ